MRAVIICVVVLSLIALGSALNRENAHHLAKRSLLETRALSQQCQQAGQACARTFTTTLNSLPANDPQLERKVCRTLRTFYDCVKRGTSSCRDPQLTTTLNQLLTEGRSACPGEFAGATYWVLHAVDRLRSWWCICLNTFSHFFDSTTHENFY